jgi:SAM-dependent methyltransferase
VIVASAERPTFLTRLRRIKYSIASTGLRRGLSDTATLLLAYHPETDHSFDRQCNTDTAGSVQPAQLGIEDASVREQAILYLPSPPRVTRWMLDNVGIDHRRFTFVDLGCGKGRVLLIASEHPFQKVVGVEISPELTAIARRNVERYQPASRRCRDVIVENADATRFDFPDTNLLIHLYHPFEPAITTAVLSRLEASLQARPRKVVLAYLLYTAAVAPVEAAFARFPWLTRRRYEQSVLGQYNWLFYSN